MDAFLREEVSIRLEETQYMLRLAYEKIKSLHLGLDYLALQLSKYECPCGNEVCFHDPFQRQKFWLDQAMREADAIKHGSKTQ